MAEKPTNKIKTLKKKLTQIDARISDAKNLARHKESKRKRSLGRILIMAGATNFYNVDDKPFNFIMSLGGLFYILDFQDFKLSVILGSCHSVISEIKNHQELQSELVKKSKSYYQDYLIRKAVSQKSRTNKNTELEQPLFLLLGVLLKAKSLLIDDGSIDKYNQLGDNIFIQHKIKQQQKYQEYLKQKNKEI